MRILKIRLSNINSIQGDWEIDFTASEYTCHGIFAITGPTGAGKSTILDAISLALYACTPRINTITQTSNEVMSRGTFDCVAELEFIAGGKTYKSVFKHHRAKSAKLQPVSHLLYEPDGENWRAITEKKTETQQKIISITGMDFEQFTRSMLLAQGNFSAFLKAKGDERAKALEKITGTSIYSEISMCALQRMREHEGELKQLNAKLEGVVLLSDEERQQRLAQVATLHSREKAEKLRQNTLNNARTWLIRIAELNQHFARAQNELTLAQTAFNASAPKRAELCAAQQAASIAVEHANLVSAQKQLTELQHKHDSLTTLQSQLQQRCARHAVIENSTKVAFETAKNALETNREHFKIVRMKDTECKAARDALTDAQRSAKQSTHALEAACNAVSSARTELSSVKDELTALKTKLAANVRFSSLAQNIGTIRAHNATLLECDQELTHTQAKCQHQHKALTDAQALLQTQNETLTRTILDTQNKQAQYEKQQKALAVLLDGQTATQWAKALQTVSQNLLRLEQLHESLRAQQQTCSQCAETEKQQALVAERLTHLQKEQAHLDTQLRAHQTAIDSLEKTLEMLTKIQQYATDRATLTDGHACPLCGATSHPFVGQLLESPDESAQKLADQKIARKQCEMRALELSRQSASLMGEIEALKKDAEKFSQQIKRESVACQLHLEHLPETLALALVDEGGHLIVEQLDALYAQLKNEASAIQDRLELVDKLQATLETLQAALAQHTALQNKLEAKKNQAALCAASAQTAMTSAQNELTCAQQRQASARDKLLLTLHAYVRSPDAIAGLQTQELAALTTKLARISETYTQMSERAATLETKQQTLETKIETLMSAKASAKASATASQTLVQQKSDSLQRLIRDRQALFGDKDVDLEEKREVAALSATEQAWTQACHARDAAQKLLEDANSQSKLTQHNIEIATEFLHQTSAAWISARERLFVDDHAWLAAYRPADVIQALSAETERINKELTEKTAQAHQIHDTLQTEQNKALTQDNLANIEMQLQALTQSLDETQQTLGGLQQQLLHDDVQKQRFAVQSKEMAQCKARLQVWSTLYDLIGSADGKKYRTFVQQLTFRALVQYANAELAKLTTRYTLKPSGADGLELNIIDHYQADAERATDNLSGGESFIVSLALALGLSKMAAKNVRIDSLFLDEGFGTLDTDTLETALNVLASLNSEGKLIGIISHVGEIRERIPVIIGVEPISGGISALSGPGVHPINA